MASQFSKIKRAINNLKSFLEYNYDEYHEAGKSFRSGQGWHLPQFEHELFAVMSGLEGNLFQELYPKLTDEVPATDNEILDFINSFVTVLENEKVLFTKIAGIRDESSALHTVAGIIQSLVIKALYQLKETLSLAEEDREFATKDATNIQTDRVDDFRMGIVTATTEEFEAVRVLLQDFKSLPRANNDAHTYYSGYFQKDEKKTICNSHQMHAPGYGICSHLDYKVGFKL
jgi:hypothetical protein